MERRREARQILSADPDLARQLCIGRPICRVATWRGRGRCQPRPTTVLAALPGLSTAPADQIVSSRDRVGGLRDLSDMSITLGTTPQTLDEAAAFLVFPRPWANRPVVDCEAWYIGAPPLSPQGGWWVLLYS